MLPKSTAGAACAKETTMKLKLFAAVAVIALLPVVAQAQNATKASAQRVVAIIKADKAKTKAYCDMGPINDQIEEAEKKKDSKTVDALSDRLEAMEKSLGPEYASLTTGMQSMKADSKEMEEIGGVLDQLDDLCK
jgi:hypothetical protein